MLSCPACSGTADRGWRCAEGWLLHGDNSKSDSSELKRERTKNHILGSPPPCFGGGDSVSLEPSFRPHWPQARSLGVHRRHDPFDGPLRSLPFFLGRCLEVPLPHILETSFADLVITAAVCMVR